MTPPSLHVTVMALNFPPEPTGISPYAGSLARGLVHRGFVTRVLTAHPHYPEWRIHEGFGQWRRDEVVDGADVHRMRHHVPSNPRGVARAISEFTFGLRLVGARWRKPDAIVAISPALIASLMAATRARLQYRRVPFIVWVQDLYSVGMVETGRSPRFSIAVMRRLERWLLRSADVVVVIHDRFAERVCTDFEIPPERVRVLRNWTHWSPPSSAVDVERSRLKFGWSPTETVVLHAGNLGLKQGLDNVVSAARQAEDRGESVRFVLLGHGSDRARLTDSARGLSTIQFIEPLEHTDFVAALHAADMLLVNELEGVSEMAAPSKLTSYFATGKPIIAATDAGGITAEELEAADAGVVVPAGDPTALLDASIELGSDPERAERLGANGLRYHIELLGETRALDEFADIITAQVAGIR